MSLHREETTHCLRRRRQQIADEEYPRNPRDIGRRASQRKPTGVKIQDYYRLRKITADQVLVIWVSNIHQSRRILVGIQCLLVDSDSIPFGYMPVSHPNARRKAWSHRMSFHITSTQRRTVYERRGRLYMSSRTYLSFRRWLSFATPAKPKRGLWG
ncbi:uncharacterized protein LAESUDRAFT_449461 [Laetiporus sulphureus 93-53]|uniref:Uncharacterized protein n=1 Tax=Laetiporus sulphureus 93-53 TaxID=1314785 RepID=A0A165BZ65_9APHY|nr:uncharacterized protein LAESUDRAFT_449461 [Laetiporus sulphureus 93-53]KZT01915.1 hypothetical protein LAESUDRAFT_449461 [Laetiporus sulphureus 93-53]